MVGTVRRPIARTASRHREQIAWHPIDRHGHLLRSLINQNQNVSECGWRSNRQRERSKKSVEHFSSSVIDRVGVMNLPDPPRRYCSVAVW